jgi:DHA1 family bicyclomycin/chloramphenicol resistance-like MFS transporter
LTLRNVVRAFREVITHRVTVVYTLVAALVSGAFLAYLNTSQQIFQVQYGLGLQFPIYFGALAAAVGLASLLNGWMVMRLGMHALTKWALYVLTMLSWLFLAISWCFDGHPPLWMFMTTCCAIFFSIGVLWGNLNAIAMEPLGHIAGTAAAAIGSTNTLIAAVLGYLIGRTYDGSLLSIALGFVGLSMVSVLLTLTAKYQSAEGAGQ